MNFQTKAFHLTVFFSQNRILDIKISWTNLYQRWRCKQNKWLILLELV